jgi:hypothetical protein
LNLTCDCGACIPGDGGRAAVSVSATVAGLQSQPSLFFSALRGVWDWQQASSSALRLRGRAISSPGGPGLLHRLMPAAGVREGTEVLVLFVPCDTMPFVQAQYVEPVSLFTVASFSAAGSLPSGTAAGAIMPCTAAGAIMPCTAAGAIMPCTAAGAIMPCTAAGAFPSCTVACSVITSIVSLPSNPSISGVCSLLRRVPSSRNRREPTLTPLSCAKRLNTGFIPVETSQ